MKKGIVIASAVLSALFFGYIVARPQKISAVDNTYWEETVTEPVIDTSQAEMIAQALYGEARSVASDTEKAAVVWAILNRVDSPYFPNSVTAVLTQPGQFNGFSWNNPTTEDLRAIAVDVLRRWYREHEGENEVGRVLPESYYYFSGDGQHNYFYNQAGNIWTWTLSSPYEN